MILLKIETKTELLKYMLLERQYDYDLMLYTFITRSNVQDIISMIDERTFSFKVEALPETISAKQFIVNLNQFVKDMKTYFYNIAPLQSCIVEIIDSSKDELKNLISYNCSGLFNRFDGEKDDVIRELTAKLIIKNFISNAKYVDSIRDVLNDVHVPLKEIKEYNLEESLKILNLLSDIAFCQRGRGPVMKLFECMDYQLNKYSNMDTTRRKKSIDDFKNSYQTVENSIIFFAGHKSLSNILRLSYFSGTDDIIDYLSKSGIKVLLTADDTRLNYNLNFEENNLINQDEILQKGDLTYVKTDIRYENTPDIEQALVNNSGEPIIVLFTHEWAFKETFCDVGKSAYILSKSGYAFV